MRLSTSPRRDPESEEEQEEEGEAEEECHSSDSLSSGISVDAFETYYRGMVGREEEDEDGAESG